MERIASMPHSFADGRFIVTAMQENVLHGWRVADKVDIAMRGYPAKTGSLSWSNDSHWLATSGADAAVIWPFKDKELTANKAPLECGLRKARVTYVAFHPKSFVVAIGYEDGPGFFVGSKMARQLWCALRKRPRR